MISIVLCSVHVGQWGRIDEGCRMRRRRLNLRIKGEVVSKQIDSSMLVLKWMDKREVMMLSTIHDSLTWPSSMPTYTVPDVTMQWEEVDACPIQNWAGKTAAHGDCGTASTRFAHGPKPTVEPPYRKALPGKRGVSAAGRQIQPDCLQLKQGTRTKVNNLWIQTVPFTYVYHSLFWTVSHKEESRALSVDRSMSTLVLVT